MLEHVPAYVTFGGVQESKAGKHVPHMPVAAARHAVPESGTGQHLPLQPQSSSSRSADAVPAAGEADGLKRISFELQQPQPQQLDGLSPESSTIAQEPPAPAEQHRRSPPSLEGGPRHRAGRLSSQGSPPAVKYARLLNGVLEPDHETLQPDRKSMSLQQGMDRRQFRPLSGSAAPPSCPVTPGIHATRNSTGAAVGDGRLHSALPSRRTSADVEHAAVVRGRLGNMSLAAGVDRQQLQLAFRGLSGLDRKLLLPAHKCLAEDSFGQGEQGVAEAGILSDCLMSSEVLLQSLLAGRLSMLQRLRIGAHCVVEHQLAWCQSCSLQTAIVVLLRVRCL